jgi:predicted RNA binding protein YcfA (HicA-like mRNA interferase family)
MRRTGFAGPRRGGKDQYMDKGSQRVILPNPHRQDIGKSLLAQLLRQAGIYREDWEKL